VKNGPAAFEPPTNHPQRIGDTRVAAEISSACLGKSSYQQNLPTPIPILSEFMVGRFYW
jgi:hypothetical protein